MKIYDCFNFYKEFSALDIRLHSLANLVDKFVLVESSESFTGIEKPYYFEENKHLFEPFLDQIIYIKLKKAENDPNKGFTNWAREFNQKNMFYRGILDADPNDIILCGDIDEIPDENILKDNLTEICEPSVFINKMSIFRINLRFFNNLTTQSTRREGKPNLCVEKEKPYLWFGTVVCQKKYLKSYCFYGGDNFRNKRCDFRQLHGGNHFTYLYADLNDVLLKNQAFSHADSHNIPGINTLENINRLINERKEFFPSGRELRKVEITKENGYNDYILNNLDKYKNLIV